MHKQTTPEIIASQNRKQFMYRKEIGIKVLETSFHLCVNGFTQPAEEQHIYDNKKFPSQYYCGGTSLN